MRTALGRLEQLALGDQPDLGLNAVRHMITAGENVVVHMGRVRHEKGAYRFVADLTRVKGLDANGDYVLERLYSGWLTIPEDPIAEAWRSL